MKHENTLIYRKSIELMDTAREAIDQFPPGFSFLADELRRNTSSIARSFAEGYGYDSKRQQRRYFGYAIQSAREASASFDTARAFRACHDDIVARGKSLALDIVGMLSKWAQRESDARGSVQPSSHQTSDFRHQNSAQRRNRPV
jgi:four helix bundle protein